MSVGTFSSAVTPCVVDQIPGGYIIEAAQANVLACVEVESGVVAGVLVLFHVGFVHRRTTHCHAAKSNCRSAYPKNHIRR